MLSSTLNTPYPPPDLLHPMAEKIQIISDTTQNQPQPAKPEIPAKPETPATPVASTPAQTAQQAAKPS